MNNNLCIVLSGGSVKGFSMLGALQYFSEIYKLNDVNCYVGTSVGSLIGYLLCIGYTPLEIVQKCAENKILEKLRTDIDLNLILKNKGIFKFDAILDELELLTLLKYDKIFTMKSLYTELNKELCCVTYNFTKKKMEILHHTTTPDLSCFIAIQMSCSIPFVFTQLKWNNCIYIDGGLIDNFPIRIALKIGKTNILGIVSNLIDTYDESEEDKNNMVNMFAVPIDEFTKRTIRKFKKNYIIIEISVPKHCLSFNLEMSEIMDMFSIGYKKCKNILLE